MLQQIYNKIKIASFMTNVLFLLGCYAAGSCLDMSPESKIG